MNHVNAVTLMHRCSKSKKHVLDFMNPDDLTSLLSSKPLSSQGIANTLYGLNSIIVSKDRNETLINKILTIVSNNLESNSEVFDSQSISNSFYGLRGLQLQGDEDESNPLLRVMRSLVDKLEYNFEISMRDELVPVNFMSPQGIGNSMLGLQGMSSTSAIVRKAIILFTSYIRHSSRPLDGQGIASVMIGLRSCCSEDPDIRELLKAICSVIQGREQYPSLKSREVSMIICGVQSMSCIDEVACILNTTISIARRSNIWLQDGNEVASALTGLKSMGCQNHIARSTVSYVAESLSRIRRRHFNKHNISDNAESLSNILNEFHIATSIFAMQNMSIDFEEANSLLRSLTAALKTTVSGYLHEQSVAKIM